MTILFCREASELKLGPGSGAGAVINRLPHEDGGPIIAFHAGVASFDDEDFPDWTAWVESASAYGISELPDDTDIAEFRAMAPELQRHLAASLAKRS